MKSRVGKSQGDKNWGGNESGVMLCHPGGIGGSRGVEEEPDPEEEPSLAWLGLLWSFSPGRGEGPSLGLWGLFWSFSPGAGEGPSLGLQDLLWCFSPGTGEGPSLALQDLHCSFSLGTLVSAGIREGKRVYPNEKSKFTTHFQWFWGSILTSSTGFF